MSVSDKCFYIYKNRIMNKETFIKKIEIEWEIKYNWHNIKKCWWWVNLYRCIWPRCQCTQPIERVWEYLRKKK